MQIEVQARFTSTIEPTRRVCEIAGAFGLGIGEHQTIEVLPPTRLTLEPGRVVFVTGASGSGKSTLLRRIHGALTRCAGVRVIDFDALSIDAHTPLIDGLGADLESATRYLSLAGLNDAGVMMRRGGELSDGQRHRYRLGLTMEAAEAARSAGHDEGVVVLADEFGSSLDRLTAQVVARQVGKWARRTGVCLIAATPHDDLLEALAPDTLIVQHPGGVIGVHERGEHDG